MRKLFLLVCLSCFSFMAWGQDSELIRKAESGDAEAQLNLGNSYRYGHRGFSKNYEEALKWYLKASEQGSVEAQYVLGDSYYYGLGCFPKNYEEAARWFLKAAEQGHAEAQKEIGCCYRFGYGVPKNDAKAESWLLKSAAQGYDGAYYSLGLFYKDDNKDEAIYWLKKHMDAWYEKYGKEDELAAESLRELGVYYHPSSKSSSVASSSQTSKSSRGNASSSSTKEGLLYKGTYTQSPQGYCPEMGTYTEAIGPGFSLTVEIYDSYITVDGSRYNYVSTSDGWKIYKGSAMFGNTPYYKVNPNNFEMKYYAISTNPYTAQTNTFIYQMQKGETTFNIHQNNSATYGGGYSTGSGTSNRTNTTTKTYQKDCHLCHGSGKCNTCNGTHRYLNPLTNKYVTCPNCRPDGRCSACGGTGKKK